MVRKPDELTDLLQTRIREEQDGTRSFEVPVWDRAWLWGVLVGLFSLDWLLRKLYRFA